MTTVNTRLVWINLPSKFWEETDDGTKQEKLSIIAIVAFFKKYTPMAEIHLLHDHPQIEKELRHWLRANSIQLPGAVIPVVIPNDADFLVFQLKWFDYIKFITYTDINPSVITTD